MTKVVDVDKFLNDTCVSITLNGKTFEVKDVPIELFDRYNASETKDLKGFVAEILNCAAEDLASYGIRALKHIIEEVFENFTSTSSPSDQ